MSELEELRAQVAALTAERDALLNPPCPGCGGYRQVWLGKRDDDPRHVWTRVAVCPICNGTGTARVSMELERRLKAACRDGCAYMEKDLMEACK